MDFSGYVKEPCSDCSGNVCTMNCGGVVRFLTLASMEASDAGDGVFPVAADKPAFRRHLIFHNNHCPQCGGDLDTGWECNDCGFDGLPEIRDQLRLEQ